MAIERNRKSRVLRFRRHGRYIEAGRFFADIHITDANYRDGPAYMSFLEGTRIAFNIMFSLRRNSASDHGRFLKKLLSDRKAEYRLSRGYTSGTNSLKNQISDIERMSTEFERDGANTFDATVTIRVFAEHPAILNDNLNRISNGLQMLGFRLVMPHMNSDSMTGNGTRGRMGKHRYLMNSLDIASILPVYRDGYAAREGVLIGVDDFTERTVYLDLFGMNSHNLLVIGETGSGKSYFTKLLVMRSETVYRDLEVTIFDPLDEYSCSAMDGVCREISLEEFLAGIPVQGPEKERGAHEGNEHPVRDTTIIKPVAEDLEKGTPVVRMMEKLNAGMMGSTSAHRIIVLDECHILLRNRNSEAMLSSMVRHSRHYNTSIVSISQNTDDFLNQASGNLAYNSNMIFVFRTRNLKENHRKTLKLDGFDYEEPARLMGGKRHPYSECIVSDGTYCRKLRVISGTSEDEKLHLG